jgi:hypothetical protein
VFVAKYITLIPASKRGSVFLDANELYIMLDTEKSANAGKRSGSDPIGNPAA